MTVQPQNSVINSIAQQFEPSSALDDAIELVAMDDEQSLAIGGDVNRVLLDLEIAEHMTGVVAKNLVVIARNVDHARTAFCHRQKQPNDVVVFLRPEETSFKTPHIDDVADEIEILSVRGLQ